MEKIRRMKIIIGLLTLACVGLFIAVVLLAVKDKAEPEVTIPTLQPTTSITTTAKSTTATTTTNPSTTQKPITPAPGVITDDSIRSLTEELLRSDINNMASYVTINIDADSDAGENLLVLEDDALNCNTIQALFTLYENFEASVDVDDNLDDEYLNVKEDFLDLIIKSEIMKITEQWMIGQDILDGNNQTLRELVDQIWFTPYAGSHSSSGVNDSTGFEHTFIGQMNGDKVLGLHNWVRYSNLEQAGMQLFVEFFSQTIFDGEVNKSKLKITPRCSSRQEGNITYNTFFNQTTFDGDNQNKGSVLKISFDWEDAAKNHGTMFVGTSPELEMALYTVCYFARPNGKCPVQLNGKQFTITTMDYNHLGVIAVANPNI